jgi:hypothetical protein
MSYLTGCRISVPNVIIERHVDSDDDDNHDADELRLNTGRMNWKASYLSDASANRQLEADNDPGKTCVCRVCF